MSDMKCPFCGQELEDQWVGQNVAHEYFDCPKCKMNGNTKLWQELIHTKKQLEIAVDALKRIEKELYFNNAKQTGHIADSVISIPSIAIEQITELEQKDK